MIHYETLRQKLLLRRKQLDRSQAEVARKMGIVVTSLNQLELGRRDNPTTETLHNWCRALECRLVIDIEPYEDLS